MNSKQKHEISSPIVENAMSFKENKTHRKIHLDSSFELNKKAKRGR